MEDLLSDTEKDRFEETISLLTRRYLSTLEPDRQHLMESYQYVHLARKVVGVGSVGTRTWIMLLFGRDDYDPLFLQIKEAEIGIEPYLGKSVFAGHGQHVVAGQKLMQAASDIFLGWEQALVGIDGKPHDFYFRQLWDWKISADIELISPGEMMVYAKMCSWTLARAHPRSGDRIAIQHVPGEEF